MTLLYNVNNVMDVLELSKLKPLLLIMCCVITVKIMISVSHFQDRRGSRVSVRPPSRQASQQELRPHSPSPGTIPK